MRAQQTLAPETAGSPLLKPACGTRRGWGRAGSNMSAPGSCVNLVHQHLNFYQLIVSRWCLSSELVFKAFKVAFIKFPWRQEWTHLSCTQSSVTDSLACCSAANCFAKLRWLLRKMVCLVLTHHHLIPCGVGKEGHWFVLSSPALLEGTYVHSLFSNPSWARSELFTPWGQPQLGPAGTVRKSGFPPHSLWGAGGGQAILWGVRTVVGFQTCSLSSWLRWQPGTFRWLDLGTFMGPQDMGTPYMKSLALCTELFLPKVMETSQGQLWPRAHHTPHRHQWLWSGLALSPQQCRQEPPQNLASATRSTGLSQWRRGLKLLFWQQVFEQLFILLPPLITHISSAWLKF